VRKTVFILGAGSSFEAGAPLMDGFIDRAADILEEGKAGEDERAFKIVLEGRDALRRVHARAKLNTSNIESLFAAFETAVLTGTLANLKGFEDINTEQLTDALRRVIRRTLETNIKLHRSNGFFGPPPEHEAFSELVRDVRADGGDPSIITFNYDLLVEYSLFTCSISSDYCLDAAGSAGQGIKVLKLHGSLNWARCETCNTISWTDVAFKKMASIINRSDVGQFLPSTPVPCRGCAIPKNQPFVIPPTWNKGQHHALIEQVWKVAARELSRASNIVIIGYSLPDSDYFFKNLFGLSTLTETDIRNILIVDPNQDAAFKARYDALFGPELLRRVKPVQEEFSDSFAQIRKLLEVPSRNRAVHG
jgi:NAD-dependent SIR2 family protein deacetylase